MDSYVSTKSHCFLAFCFDIFPVPVSLPVYFLPASPSCSRLPLLRHLPTPFPHLDRGNGIFDSLSGSLCFLANSAHPFRRISGPVRVSGSTHPVSSTSGLSDVAGLEVLSGPGPTERTRTRWTILRQMMTWLKGLVSAGLPSCYNNLIRRRLIKRASNGKRRTRGPRFPETRSFYEESVDLVTVHSRGRGRAGRARRVTNETPPAG